jgi:hypothetical protein
MQLIEYCEVARRRSRWRSEVDHECQEMWILRICFFGVRRYRRGAVAACTDEYWTSITSVRGLFVKHKTGNPRGFRRNIKGSTGRVPDDSICISPIAFVTTGLFFSTTTVRF